MKTNLRIIFLVILLLQLCLLHLFAGGALRGKVMDQDGQPLAFANVVLLQEGKLVAGVSADINGRYEMLSVPVGTYRVKVSFIGYSPVEYSGIQIREAQVTAVDVQLVPAVAVLNEVILEYEQPLMYKSESIWSNSSSYSSSTDLGLRNRTANTVLKNDVRERRFTAYSPSISPTVFFQDGVVIGETWSRESGWLLDGSRTLDTKDPQFVQVPPPPPLQNPPVQQVVEWVPYPPVEENPEQNPMQEPLSTFSIDVDKASYSLIRRYIQQGTQPPPGTVRLEEMINYFDYSYPQPVTKHPFSINLDMGVCPWNEKHRLVLIGLQGRDIPVTQMPPANLVFLIDVSGSMTGADRLPLVKTSLLHLVDALRPQDKVSIVVYAGRAGLVLPPTAGDEKQKIRNAIDRLESGGSTAGGAGIQLAYQQAEFGFMQEGNNRVILATDGDFNVGVSNDDELVTLIEEKRKTGVFLSVLGFGMGNYQDTKMEKLADKGNGNYAYIDSEREAFKVLVSEMSGTLYTIAKDVKLQVEFNPARVKTYRLLGYENRVLENWEFNDDTRDAGELGAGHNVTALYELELYDAPLAIRTDDALKYQDLTLSASVPAHEVLTIHFRYKRPKEEESHLMEAILEDEHKSFEMTSENLRFAAAVAGFGLMLRNSAYKGTLTYMMITDLAKDALGTDTNGERKEFLELVRRMESLAGGK